MKNGTFSWILMNFVSTFSEGRLAKISPEMNDSGSLSGHLFFYRIKKFVFKKKLEVWKDSISKNPKIWKIENRKKLDFNWNFFDFRFFDFRKIFRLKISKSIFDQKFSTFFTELFLNRSRISSVKRRPQPQSEDHNEGRVRLIIPKTESGVLISVKSISNCSF